MIAVSSIHITRCKRENKTVHFNFPFYSRYGGEKVTLECRVNWSQVSFLVGKECLLCYNEPKVRGGAPASGAWHPRLGSRASAWARCKRSLRAKQAGLIAAPLRFKFPQGARGRTCLG